MANIKHWEENRRNKELGEKINEMEKQANRDRGNNAELEKKIERLEGNSSGGRETVSREKVGTGTVERKFTILSERENLINLRRGNENIKGNGRAYENIVRVGNETTKWEK